MNSVFTEAQEDPIAYGDHEYPDPTESFVARLVASFNKLEAPLARIGAWLDKIAPAVQYIAGVGYTIAFLFTGNFVYLIIGGVSYLLYFAMTNDKNQRKMMSYWRM